MAVFNKIKAFYNSNALASMEDTYRNSYTELGAQGLLNKDQAAWAGANPPDWREYVDDTTGEPTGGIGDDYLEEFFDALLETFRAVADDRKSIASNPAITKFLDTYYGAGKLFEPFTIDASALPAADLIAISGEISGDDKVRRSLGMTHVQYAEFCTKITTPGELQSKKLREQFQSVLGQLRQTKGQIKADLRQLNNLKFTVLPGVTQGGDAWVNLSREITDLEDRLASTGITPIPATAVDMGIKITDISNSVRSIDDIQDVLEYDINSIPRPAELERVVNDILKKFSDSKDIREAFLPKMNYEYANAISDGISKTDYKEGKNKIAPYYADKKMFFARAKDRVKKLQDDYLGKYLSKAKREQMPPIARAIFNEIEVLKIKPTDGLAKVLENADKIKAKLPASAVTDFDFMVGTLKSLSSTTQFKDALKSGKQMLNLVENLADIAADEKDEKKRADKEEQIKKLQFILNGLSYGLTTSSVRGELKKNPLKVFSDPGLSWNKHESLKFMANATDKVLNLGFMMAFNLTNMAKNKLRGMNSKFGAGKQAIAIKDAQKYVNDNPTLTIADYEANVARTRNDYESAAKSGDKSADAKKKLWQKDELLLQTAKQKEERDNAAARGEAPKKNTQLDTKLRLMAHWDFVRGGKANEISLGSHLRTEKEFHNKINPATGKTMYETVLETHLGQWNSGMAA